MPIQGLVDDVRINETALSDRVRGIQATEESRSGKCRQGKLTASCRAPLHKSRQDVTVSLVGYRGEPCVPEAIPARPARSGSRQHDAEERGSRAEESSAEESRGRENIRNSVTHHGMSQAETRAGARGSAELGRRGGGGSCFSAEVQEHARIKQHLCLA